MTQGRMSYSAKHTVVPRVETENPECPHGDIVTYQLSQEELAKYRAIPTDSEKWTVFRIPMRGQKA